MSDHQPITQACPQCVDARKLLHRLVCELDRCSAVRLVTTIETDDLDQRVVSCYQNRVVLHCKQCKDHGEILTEFGAKLAKMAKDFDDRDYVPEEVFNPNDTVVHAFLSDPPN